ncbi:MAG: hypothetical protein AAGA66_02680 [Bacteroidota bacterium]
MKTHQKTPIKKTAFNHFSNKGGAIIEDHRPERILQRKLLERMNADSGNTYQIPTFLQKGDARKTFQLTSDEEEHTEENEERNNEPHGNVIDLTTYEVDPVAGEPFMETLVRAIAEQKADIEETIEAEDFSNRSMNRRRENRKIRHENRKNWILGRNEIKPLKRTGQDKILSLEGNRVKGKPYKDSYRNVGKAIRSAKKDVTIRPVENQIWELWKPLLEPIIRNLLLFQKKKVITTASLRTTLRNRLDQAIDLVGDGSVNDDNPFYTLIREQVDANVIDANNISSQARNYIHWVLDQVIVQVVANLKGAMTMDVRPLYSKNDSNEDSDDELGQPEPMMDMGTFNKKYHEDDDNPGITA